MVLVVHTPIISDLVLLGAKYQTVIDKNSLNESLQRKVCDYTTISDQIMIHSFNPGILMYAPLVHLSLLKYIPTMG